MQPLVESLIAHYELDSFLSAERLSARLAFQGYAAKQRKFFLFCLLERAETKNTIPKLRKKASRYKGNVKFYAVVRLNGCQKASQL